MSKRFPAVHAALDRRGDHRRRRRGAALGLDHQRPAGARVRGARCRRYFGGRPVRALSSATGAHGDRAGARRRRPRRRGHHHAAVLGRDRQRDRARRRAAGVRRRRSAHAQHRPRRASRRRSRRARARSCRWTWPACRSIATGCTPSPSAQAARDRGRRAVDRRELARAQRIGAIGDLVSFSFHPNKNITTHRGRLPGAERRRTRRGAASCCACRAWSASPDGTWTSTLRRRQVQPDRRRRAHRPRPARRTSRTSPRGAARWRGATSSASTARSAASCRSRTSRNSNWHMFQVAAAARTSQRARLHRARCTPRASASACTIRRCTCSRSTGSWASSPGDFPHAERIGARHRDAAAVSGHARRRRRSRLRGGRAVTARGHDAQRAMPRARGRRA